MGGDTLAVRGTAFHTPSPDRLDVLSDVVISVDASGTITAILRCDVDAAASGPRQWDVDSEERLFEEVVRLAGPETVPAVWVGGVRVLG